MAHRVSYIFSATDRFSGVANKIGRQSDQLRGKMGRLGTVMRGGGRGGGVVGMMGGRGMLAGGGIMAAGLAGYKALMPGLEFEQAMADLASVTSLTSDGLDKISEKTLQLSTDSRIAATDVTAAYASIASNLEAISGDPEALSRVTKEVLLLKNAANIPISEAASTITGVLSQFKLPADEVERVSNVLAAGQKKGSSFVYQTAAALEPFGAIAHTFSKLSIEETVAAIQVLAKDQLKMEKAGTAMRTFLLVLEGSGIDAVKPSVHGLAQALRNLSKVIDITDSKKMEKAFGREGVLAATILANNVPLLEYFENAITGTSIATEQAAKRLDTSLSRIGGAGNAFKNFWIKDFEWIADNVAAMSEWVLGATTHGPNLNYLTNAGWGGNLAGALSPPQQMNIDTILKIMDPSGVVDYVTTRISGDTAGVNAGVNMVTEQ